MTPRGRSAAWLVHPLTLLAAAVLVVNDHVLKAAWPGPVTGKLSDVAGLVVAPAVLAVVTRAPARVALVVTGVGFALVKGTAAGAVAASAAWTYVAGPSLVRADRTDLLALPALAVAGYAARRAAARPLTRDRARRLAVAVVLPVVALGLAASAASRGPYRFASATTFTQWKGLVLLGADTPRTDRLDQWMVSGDGGATFADEPPLAALASLAASPGAPVAPLDPAAADWTGDLRAALPTLTLSGRQDCVPSAGSTGGAGSAHCFRAVPGHLRVEETTDGGAHWRIAWQVSDLRRSRLAAGYADLGDVDAELSSRAVLVLPKPDGTFTVLVANGRDGMARREPDGTWHRIAFTGEPQPALGNDPWSDTADGFRVALAFTVAVAVLVVGLWGPARATDRLGLPFLSAVLAGLAAWFTWNGRRPLASRMLADGPNRAFHTAGTYGSLALALIVLFGTVWGARTMRAAGLRPMLGWAVAGGLGAIAPMIVGDLAGWPPMLLADGLGVAVAVVAAAGAARVGARYSTHPRPPKVPRTPPVVPHLSRTVRPG